MLALPNFSTVHLFSAISVASVCPKNCNALILQDVLALGPPIYKGRYSATQFRASGQEEKLKTRLSLDPPWNTIWHCPSSRKRPPAPPGSMPYFQTASLAHLTSNVKKTLCPAAVPHMKDRRPAGQVCDSCLLPVYCCGFVPGEASVGALAVPALPRGEAAGSRW